MTERSRRWLAVTAALVAAGAWLLSRPAFHVGLGIMRQAGSARAMGVALVVVAALAALAALAAVPIVRGDLDRGRFAGLAGDAFVALVVGSLALIGLAVNYTGFAAVPLGVRVATAIGALACFAAYQRNPPGIRRSGRRALQGLTLAVLATPFLVSPWILWSAWTDRPRLATAVDPLEGPRRPDAPRRIVLLSFDGLQAGALHLDEPDGPTPAFADLAAASDRWSLAIAGGDQTRIALPVLLTGLDAPQIFPYLPNAYGLFREGSLTGIAGHLRPAGYRTAYATGVVKPDYFAMDREYDAGGGTGIALFRHALNSYEFLPLAGTLRALGERFVPAPRSGLPNDAISLNDRVMDRALGLLRSDEPTFLWFHAFLPHAPYMEIPEESLDGPHTPSEYRLVSPEEMVAAEKSPAKRSELRRVYGSFVRYTDRYLGRFIAALKAADMWDDTLLIVTSDHGESFKTPGRLFHASGHVAQETIEIPLLIKAPGRRPGQGRVLPGVVGQIDVVPTVIDAVYGRVPAGLPGIPLLRARPRPDRTLMTWAPPANAIGRTYEEIAAIRGHFKLVREADGSTRLRDLRNPEPRDVKADHPALAAELDAWLRRHSPQ